jgi:hypothetical protein
MARLAGSPDFEGNGSMLAIAISILFALAAFAALAVIRSSVIAGWRRARAILAVLAEIERRGRITRTRPARPRPQPAFLPALAAA